MGTRRSRRLLKTKRPVAYPLGDGDGDAQGELMGEIEMLNRKIVARLAIAVLLIALPLAVWAVLPPAVF